MFTVLQVLGKELFVVNPFAVLHRLAVIHRINRAFTEIYSLLADYVRVNANKKRDRNSIFPLLSHII